MEESGQRSTHTKIIDRPVLKSPLRYLFEGSFTLALWALWVYWLMPIFTLLLWVFGFHLYYSENITRQRSGRTPKHIKKWRARRAVGCLCHARMDLL